MPRLARFDFSLLGGNRIRLCLNVGGKNPARVLRYVLPSQESDVLLEPHMLRLALAWRWNGHVIHIEGGGVAMIHRCVQCSTAACRRSKVHEGGEIRARLQYISQNFMGENGKLN